MIFFTYAIPFLCGTFAILVSNLVDLYTETFLKEDENEAVDETGKGE